LTALRQLLLGLLCAALPMELYAQARWSAGGEPQVFDDQPVTPSCRARIPQVTRDSSGPLRPEMTLTELERVCPRLRYGWASGEGEPYPVVFVSLGGAVVGVAFADTLASSRVYTIMTSDRRMRTGDRIRPGITFGEVTRLWGRMRFGSAECNLAAWSEQRPGLSLLLSLPEGWGCEEISDAIEGRRPIPATTLVEAILIYVDEPSDDPSPDSGGQDGRR
jgi:hypothetical protein